MPDAAHAQTLRALAALSFRVGLLHRLAGATETDLRTACPEPQQHGSFAGCSACRRAYEDQDIALSAAFARTRLPDPWGTAAGELIRQDQRPQEAALVREADRLAGSARLNGGPLRSVLAILAEHAASPRAAAFLPLVPLELTRQALFPTSRQERPSALQYQQLWRGLRDEAELFRQSYLGASLDACLVTLDALLLKYAWSVPWQTEEGISLYQHLSNSAAIAACLEEGPARATPPEKSAEFALVAGDLSGIQSFLYTIAAKGAGRSLRARSLYLDLLCDMLARWLLHRLDLPQTSLLYSGGGRFYLVAPARALAAWPDLRAEMSTILLRHHQADLGIVTAAVQTAGTDLDHFEQTWGRVNSELAAAKRRRFSELPPDQIYGDVFSPRPAVPLDRLCGVCSRAEAEVSAVDEVPRCRTCATFEDLGRRLVDARYLVLRHSGDARGNASMPVFGDLGYDIDLTSQPAEALRQAGTGGAVLALNDTAFLSGPLGQAIAGAREHPALGIRFLAQSFPRGPGGYLLDFDALGQAARGVDRLGVLRMDVDDLGMLFGSGLRGGGLTGVSALSLALRIFFEGYLNTILSEFNTADQGDAGRVYSVYAGGDDLFVVGSWDAMPELAMRIRDEFGAYAGNDPAVHISAGIAVIGTRSPLYLGAEEAGEALDSGAKRYRGPSGESKDAVSFLGHTRSWAELRAIREAVARLEDLVEPASKRPPAPRGLLQFLQILGERQRADAGLLPAHGPSAVHYGPWMWLSAYQLTRMAEQRKELRAELGQLQRDLLQPGSLERISFAARWAEYLLRGRGHD